MLKWLPRLVAKILATNFGFEPDWSLTIYFSASSILRMATLDSANTPASGGGKSSSIVDDFMYGSNVAGAHVYIRMGKSSLSLVKLPDIRVIR